MGLSPVSLAADRPTNGGEGMTALGHEDQFPSPRPSDRCRASQETSPAREARAKRATLMGRLNSGTSLGDQRRAQRAATNRVLQRRRTVMIADSHTEGPDPYGGPVSPPTRRRTEGFQ